jgi:hypothetical protein
VEQLADKRAIGDPEQAASECALLEVELVELKAAYEQFFLGVERVSPAKRHAALKKRLLGLKGVFVRQTALKFRIQTLASKLTTYERLWERSIAEIEAGTYRKDLLRAKRHQLARQKPAADAPPRPAEEVALAELDEAPPAEVAAPAPPPARPPFSAPSSVLRALEGPPAIAPARPSVPPAVSPSAVLRSPTVAPTIAPARPSVPPASSGSAIQRPPGAVPAIAPVRASLPPAGAAARPPTAPLAPPGQKPVITPALARSPAEAASAAGGLTDQKIKAIYEAYVMAKKRCGEDTRNLTLDSVASSLKKQVPALLKQHQARTVEFKVVIKDGRAVLRALPRDAEPGAAGKA